MLQSDDLASKFLLPECFCNNSLVGCTVYTSYNGSTSQHKQASFNIGTTYVQLTKIKFGLMPFCLFLPAICVSKLSERLQFQMNFMEDIHYSWHEYVFTRAALCHQLHLYFFLVFISIHNDGARKWEPC